MNKANYKNIFRFAVAALLAILAICVLCLPTLTAKVSVADPDKSSPYTGNVKMSPIQQFDTEQDIARNNDNKDFRLEDVSIEEQVKYMYVSGGDGSDGIGSEFSSILSVPTLEGSSDGASGFISYAVIFFICAILVGLMANKAAYGVTIIACAYFVIGLFKGVFTRAGVYAMSAYNDDVEFIFYDYANGAGFVLDIILIVLIVAASAFAVANFTASKATTAVTTPGGATPPYGFSPEAPVGGGSTPGAHQLTCVAGEFRGATFAVNNGEMLTIGRDSNVSNIVVVAPKISRKHCTIRFDAFRSCYYVTDFSSNGTITMNNGARLNHGVETSVPCGTVISLGNNDNQFRLD